MVNLSLVDALGLPPRCRVAVVGAGGKTSLLFRLARALTWPVLVSNTAHLAVEQGAYADRVITAVRPGDLPDGAAPLQGVTLVTGPVDQRGRTGGLEGETLEGLLRVAEDWGAPLLIEADGSRGRPLKAPAEWEPPIPAFVDTVLVVAGLSGLGKALTKEWVYRPEDFAALAGMPAGALVILDGLVKVLCHPRGGLRNIPGGARRIALLNQADTDELREQAAQAASGLLGAYRRVVVASLHGPGADGSEAQIHAVHQRAAGIVLAAGAAQRMGQPKQLLEWQGEPLVRRQARIALEAGLDPVIVVTGAYAEQVSGAVTGLKLRVVNNPGWTGGQSASVRAGLAVLGEDPGAAVFLLADQPFVEPEVIRRLVAEHARTLAAVVAPQVGGRRANPVLFDRRTFADLAALEGDAGGRQVMGKWGVHLVDWPDARLLVDVDNLEDYHRALELK